MSKLGYLGNTPYELFRVLSVEVPTQKQYYTYSAANAHYRERIQRIRLILYTRISVYSGREAIYMLEKRNPYGRNFHCAIRHFYKITKMDVAATWVKYIVDFYSRCDEVWAVSESSAQLCMNMGLSAHCNYANEYRQQVR
jgi:hypothetical protein